MKRETRNRLGAALVLAATLCGCSINRTYTATIPAGTRLTVSIVDLPGADGISSWDAFETRTVDAVTVGGETVIPAGTIVRARLSDGGSPDRVLHLDRFQNARGEWQVLPVNSIHLEAGSRGDDSRVAPAGSPGIRLIAGQKLHVRTQVPMDVTLIGSRRTDLAGSL